MSVIRKAVALLSRLPGAMVFQFLVQLQRIQSGFIRYREQHIRQLVLQQ